MSVTIQEAVSKYNTVITTALEKMKGIHSGYVCKHPDWLRDNYDGTRQVLEAKTIEINEKKNYITECIKNLENCKKSLSEMEEVIKEINIASNEGRVGTLQGLCLHTIKQNKIPMDEIEETVFSFPYDEKNEIEKFKKSIENIGVKEVVNNLGGKNNTKRKNYIAKNVNNKKSKKRRFK
jgi:dissimilatory sulfite reductase (desulfoviridin) alpha/beta subunit